MRLPNTFEEWQTYCRVIRQRSDKLQRSLHDHGWELAATVGIPRCGCSLHNASIDDDMTGWCKGNPHRLKVAKRANHILSDWTVSNIADRIISRGWKNMAKQKGWAHQ